MLNLWYLVRLTPLEHVTKWYVKKKTHKVGGISVQKGLFLYSSASSIQS